MAVRRKKAAARNPRVLVVTPEITYLPPGMGSVAFSLTAKAGGLADVSAALVSALFELGADVHVALPHYRRMFHVDVGNLISEELRLYRSKLPDERIHLAEDRIFYYRDAVYSNYRDENPRIAMAFQREVINNIIPVVKPDLIHCNDWMTGLIPAVARRLSIPCLFTVHNIHSHQVTLSEIEDRGIDAADFWLYLYYSRVPQNYEETRATNPADLLTSGLFASHFINTVSPTFLEEIVQGRHDFVAPNLRAEFISKKNAGCATGILNSPDTSYDPATDNCLEVRYTAETHVDAKLANKRKLQDLLGLDRVDNAPLFFWPSRLDPVQKGCQLLTHILNDVATAYADDRLQLAVIANGPFQKHFHDIVRMNDLGGRVAVCDFDDRVSHLAYAASDFVLMPSLFEPCGLPQMIGVLYGTLPLAHNTGGLHDTVSHLDLAAGTGNGFLFDVFDAPGLRWAIDEAMRFYRQPAAVRSGQVARIMREGKQRFNHDVTAQEYIDIYERMLNRPLVSMF